MLLYFVGIDPEQLSDGVVNENVGRTIDNQTELADHGHKRESVHFFDSLARAQLCESQTEIPFRGIEH